MITRMTPHLRYTTLIWALLPLLDKGESLDISATHAAIQDRSVFDLLARKYGEEFTLTASLLPSDERVEIMSRFSDMPGGREFGVSRNGLTLLVAYCAEMIQQVVRESLDPRPRAVGTTE